MSEIQNKEVTRGLLILIFLDYKVPSMF